MLGRLVFFVHAEFGIFVIINGVGTNFIGTVEADASEDALVDGARKDEATIIVGVLANQVDTTRGGVDNTLCAKTLHENVL